MFKYIWLIIVLSLLVSGCKTVHCQVKDDFFKTYVKKRLSNHGFSFEAIKIKKELFSEDTVLTHGQVRYYLKDTSLIYFHIMEPDLKSELLYFRDSLWVIDHVDKTIDYLGDIRYYESTGLSSYFPYERILLPDQIFLSEPFWRYGNSKGSQRSVEFVIDSLPSGLTQLKVFTVIDTLEWLVTNLMISADFGTLGNQYQEVQFTNHLPFEIKEFNKPAYFETYHQTIEQASLQMDVIQEIAAEQKDTSCYMILDSIKLITMEGIPFQLPISGIIFFDLWYVGCYPCLLAAPEIEKVYNKFGGKIHFYSINDMDKDDAKMKSFMEKMQINVPVLKTEKQRRMFRSKGSNAYPYFVLFEAETGRILWEQEGLIPNLDKTLSDIIESALSK